MRRPPVLGTLSLSLLLTAACAPVTADSASAPRPSATAAGTAGPEAAGTAEPNRDAQIYIAVLRRYLTTPQDNSNLTFASVFVLDYTDPSAADPIRTAPSTATTPISAADQHTIAGALHDVAPLQFVATRDQAIIHGKDGCAVVRDNGILILLGPATPVGDTMQVAINGFAACLGATWFTYIVVPHTGGWAVTGTTGTAAIS
jgi:hypothetical protein